MNKYQVFIDVALDGDWNNIDVESLEIEAKSPKEAADKASEIYMRKGLDFYVWEVSNDDIIE